MKVFTCTGHDGHGRGETATVIVARTEARARQLLDDRLRRMGHKTSIEQPYELTRLDCRSEKVRVLSDGLPRDSAL